MPGKVGQAAAGGARNFRTARCAIVLEDQPTGIDARMPFESFEQEIEEAYSLDGYQEYAANRMPQPGYVAYRGGNWSPMNLTLHFRADGPLNKRIALGQIQASDVEGILIDMERRVRWFEALGFPLRRSAGAFAERQIARAQAAGFDPIPAASTALRNQVRNDPPILLLVFGSFLIIRGYLTNVSLRWLPPFHPVTVRPYGCTVTLAIQRIDAAYPTWRTIRNSAGESESSPTNITGSIQLSVETERELERIRGQTALGDVSREHINQNNILVRQQAQGG